MKGLRALGVRFPGPGRALASNGRMLGRTDARSDGRTEIPPRIYRKSSPLGPKRAAASKRIMYYRTLIRTALISKHRRRVVAGVRPTVVLQCMTEPGYITKKNNLNK